MSNLFLNSSAVISADGLYRYRLTREWDATVSKAVFVMLNPSTADTLTDDATIRSCCRFARFWDLGGIEVVNLFAARCTDPKGLKRFADPVGPENDAHIRGLLAHNNQPVIAAWGAQPGIEARVRQVLALIRETGNQPAQCLGLTRGGAPRHPLYLTTKTALVPMGKTP